MRSVIALVVILATLQSLDCEDDMSTSRLNFFDIDLLRYSAEDKKGNVMVSPASIKSTLALILEGSEGPTAAEIRSALRLSPLKEDFREELSLFFKALQVNTSSVSLQSANGLFVSKKLQLKKQFEMVAKSLYHSEVKKVDFNNPKTAIDAINGWVSGKTRGLIPSVIEEVHVNPSTEIIVTNALYFKSDWLHAFEPSLTHGDCFYKDGICKTVAMMDLQAELKYAYVENLRAHALELPYKGERYSMILLVPQDRDASDALIRDLPYIGLLQISNLMEKTDVILSMPKFTVEYSDDMVATLKSMRIETLFSSSANLSGILEGTSAYVNSIFHTVYMSVDEKGTVAAAATAAMVVPLINDQVQLRVDRPFLFFIRDNYLGLVLFEGKIEEPTELKPVNVKTGPNQFKNQPVPQKPISNTLAFKDRPAMSQRDQIQPILSRPIDSPPIWSRISDYLNESQLIPSLATSQPTQNVPASSQPNQSPPIPSQPSSSLPSTSSPTPSQSTYSQSTTTQATPTEVSTSSSSEKKSSWRSWFSRIF